MLIYRLHLDPTIWPSFMLPAPEPVVAMWLDILLSGAVILFCLWGLVWEFMNVTRPNYFTKRKDALLVLAWLVPVAVVLVAGSVTPIAILAVGGTAVCVILGAFLGLLWLWDKSKEIWRTTVSYLPNRVFRFGYALFHRSQYKNV
jgi:hypothetical protein